MSGLKGLFPNFEDQLDHELFTRISLAGGIITVGYSLFTFPAGFIEYSLFNLLTGTICFISFFLSKAKKYNFSFWMFFLALPALMFLYVYKFGLINAHLYLISGMVIVSYLVKAKKYWSEIIWVVSGAFFIGSYVVLFTGDKYQELDELESLLFFPNIVAALVLIYIATKFFRDQQESQRRELIETVELRNTLLNILSHDLRSPISSLKALLAINDDEELPAADLQKALNLIRSEVDSTGNMLDNLLYWTKGQTNGLTVKKEPILIKPFVQEYLDLFQIQIAKKGIDVELDLNWFELTTDREMFGIIFRNLLSNAVKFSDKSNGKIVIHTSSTKNGVLLSIYNNGPIITDEQRKQLFIVGPSQRGTLNEKGHGIGLPLVKLFCDELDIGIAFDTKSVDGTKCNLKLPLA